MGSSASKPEMEAGAAGETTFFATRDSPVQFSESLISHLSANSTATPSSTNPSSERQSTLDSHIQSRIAAELARLQQEENHVRQQIEQALEKENLDKERGDDGAAHSVSLLKDLQQLEQRLESNKEESKRIKAAAPWDVVASNKAALTECLSGNLETPLNCQLKVLDFIAAVAAVEKAFVVSIQ